jgi:hypothetical protein
MAGDEKMNEYLRPATLFNRTKFAQYQGELVTTGAPREVPRLPRAIDIEATNCRCGWRAAPAAGAYRVAGEAGPCAGRSGATQPAMNGFAHCQACAERIRHEQAEAACRARGLDTVEKKRAYCRS